MDPTFDDLIPTPQADALQGGDVNFDDLIPGHPAYVSPGGDVDFDDLIPNQGAPWPPSARNAGADYPARTFGNPIAGHELAQSQSTWGGSIFIPDGSPSMAAGFAVGRDLSPQFDGAGSKNAGSPSAGPTSRNLAAPLKANGPSSPKRPSVSFDPTEASVPPDGPPRNYRTDAAPIPTLEAGVPNKLNLPFNMKPLPDVDWSLGPIGVIQAPTYPLQPTPGPAESLATGTLQPQQSVGVVTLLTANQKLKVDGIVTSDRYDSDGRYVRDFLDAKTGEIIGSASPYNGAGLQQLSDGLTFVRYDAGAASSPAPGVTNAEVVAAELYDRTARDWWDAYNQNGQNPFASGVGFNKPSKLRAYGMLNAISAALANRYVDWGMFNLNSIAMIGGLLPTDNWSASAMRYALAAPQEGAGAGYRSSGALGYEPLGPSGLNRYGGFLPAEALSHLTLPSQLPADFDTNSPIGRFAWLPYAKPGNTLGGEDAHVWIGNLFRRAAPTDAISELNTAPGSRGVDINVDPDRVSDVGFRHGEIKPNSAYGIRSYNDQVKNWGLTDPVQAISYDKDGNIYLGFPKVK